MIFVCFTISVYAVNEFSITLDKSIYFLRDAVIINGSLDRLVSDEDKIKFEIINPHGIIVDRFEIEINDLVFTHSLSLIEHVWNEDGLYRLRATYADSVDTAYFHVFQSNTGVSRHIDSTIGFDQEKYGWTDEVEIFVIAPNFNRDNGVIEKIGMGTDPSGTVTIKTSKGKLDNYMLTESDVDSGIFSGTLVLTGDPSRDANGDGIRNNDAPGETSGRGSNEGQLGVLGSDNITVIFKNEDEEIESSSKISWMLGKFQEISEQIDNADFIKIKIHDNDLNFKNIIQDTAYVIVWSDSDNKQSQKIKLIETSKKSGIFEGFVKLSTEKSGLDKIKIQNPDVLHIKYFDNTVPIEISNTNSQDVIVDITIGKPIYQQPKTESTLEIPSWIRNNAKWYAEGKIGESEFTQGIGHMIKNNIIHIPNLPEKSDGSTASKVPDWIKNNAKWWSESQISDGDFVKGIEYLVKVGIIKIN